MTNMTPTHIAVHQKSRQFEIHFSDGTEYNLPCEYLRVFSPSAEVRAAKNRGELIRGKQDVNINSVEPMGSYAVRILFDDGHDTGIYSWLTLKTLGENFDTNWQHYQQQLDEVEQNNSTHQKVTILFFIGLVDKLGTDKIELELTDELKTVADIIQLLSQKGEAWKNVLEPSQLTITVNKQFSTVDQQVFNGDEIALVPKG